MNQLGWPDSEEGIRRLINEMDSDQKVVCMCGRFIKQWNGWRFMFPSTMTVIEAIDKGQVKELVFVEDEES